MCIVLPIKITSLHQIFMKPEFVLNDPTTFNAVLPWSHFSVAGGKNSRDVASSRLLQEKVPVWGYRCCVFKILLGDFY